MSGVRRPVAQGGVDSMAAARGPGPRSPEARQAMAAEAMVQAHRRELVELDERMSHRLSHLEHQLGAVAAAASTSGRRSADSPFVPAGIGAPTSAATGITAVWKERIETLEQKLETLDRAEVASRLYKLEHQQTGAQQPSELSKQQDRLETIAGKLGAIERRLGHEGNADFLAVSLRVEALERRSDEHAQMWTELNGTFEETAGELGAGEGGDSATSLRGSRTRTSYTNYDGAHRLAEDELAEVREVVGEARASLEHALSSMKNELNEVRFNLERMNSHTDLAVPLETAVKERDRYKVKASVWDAAIFLFHSALDRYTQALLIIAFVTNFLIQVLLCAIVIFAIAVDSYPTNLVDDLLSWRANANSTQVDMLCQGDPTLTTHTFQANLYDEAEEYNAELRVVSANISIGPVLCAIVIFMWTLNVSSVIRDIVDFIKAMSIVHRKRSDFYIGTSSACTFKLEGLNSARYCFAVFSGICQIVVAVLLLCGGSLWLVYTKSIKDLMLNAVALAYVMEFDELLYNVIIPRKVKALIDGLEPLALNRHTPGMAAMETSSSKKFRCPCCPKHWPKKAVLTSVAAVGFEALAIFAFIRPHSQKVWEVRGAMCPS